MKLKDYVKYIDNEEEKNLFNPDTRLKIFVSLFVDLLVLLTGIPMLFFVLSEIDIMRMNISGMAIYIIIAISYLVIAFVYSVIKLFNYSSNSLKYNLNHKIRILIYLIATLLCFASMTFYNFRYDRAVEIFEERYTFNPSNYGFTLYDENNDDESINYYDDDYNGIYINYEYRGLNDIVVNGISTNINFSYSDDVDKIISYLSDLFEMDFNIYRDKLSSMINDYKKGYRVEPIDSYNTNHSFTIIIGEAYTDGKDFNLYCSYYTYD